MVCMVDFLIAVMTFYNGRSACVSENESVSEGFKINMGVRQGSDLSPRLFVGVEP